MVALEALCIPIIVAAVFVFVVSSLIHMVFQWHKSDYRPLAKESEAADGLRASNPTPGIYHLPHCADMKEMGKPEMVEKMKRGPNAMIVVLPNGAPPMAKLLGLWFVYCLLVGLFCAYVAGHTLGAGTDYLAVFRVVGSVAFAAYVLPNMVDSIWKGFPWAVTFRHMFDGVLYSLFTAGTFGWLWPR
jgi:hypothetical protein